MSLLHCLGHTTGSIQALGKCIHFVTRPVFMVTICLHLAPPPSWRTTPHRLSMTAYSIYLQLPSILEAIPTSTNWGRAMPWWCGPTYHGHKYICMLKCYRLQTTGSATVPLCITQHDFGGICEQYHNMKIVQMQSSRKCKRYADSGWTKTRRPLWWRIFNRSPGRSCARDPLVLRQCDACFMAYGD